MDMDGPAWLCYDTFMQQQRWENGAVNSYSLGKDALPATELSPTFSAAQGNGDPGASHTLLFFFFFLFFFVIIVGIASAERKGQPECGRLPRGDLLLF